MSTPIIVHVISFIACIYCVIKAVEVPKNLEKYEFTDTTDEDTEY